MSLLVALKFVCYFALYFSVFSVFDLWMNSYLLFLSVILLSCLSIGLTHKFKEKTPLRIIFSLIPFISFILCAKPLDFLVTGIPIGFSFLAGIFKRGKIEYWDHISTFKILSIIFFLFLLFGLMTNINYYNIIFYGIIALISGVFVSRELRLGVNTSTKEKIYNFVFVSTVPLFLSIVFLIILRPEISFGKVFEYILTPFAAIFYVFIKAFSLISNLVAKQEQPEAQEIEKVINEFQDELVLKDGDISKPNPEVRTNYDYIFIIASIVIAVIVIGYILYRIVVSMKKESSYKQEYTDYNGESIYVESEKKAKKSNGYKIRKIYSKYLSFIESYGVFRKKHNTSQDILENASKIFVCDEQAMLRKLYIKARYDNEESITDEDVVEAKNLLKEIKNVRRRQLAEASK